MNCDESCSDETFRPSTVASVQLAVTSVATIETCASVKYGLGPKYDDARSCIPVVLTTWPAGRMWLL